MASATAWLAVDSGNHLQAGVLAKHEQRTTATHLLVQAVGCSSSGQLLAMLMSQLQSQAHVFLRMLEREGCRVLVLLHAGPLQPAKQKCLLCTCLTLQPGAWHAANQSTPICL